MDSLVIGFEPKSISGFCGKLPKRLIWTKKVFFRIDIPTILKPELEKKPRLWCTDRSVLMVMLARWVLRKYDEEKPTRKGSRRTGG